MTLAYSTTIRNAQVDVITTQVGNAGKLRIYSGSRPATGGTATTLLAELTLGSPLAAAASSAVLTFNAVTSDTSADSTGTATWFRIVTSGGTFCIDGDVATSASDLNINTTSIVSGATVAVTSATITAGNA